MFQHLITLWRTFRNQFFITSLLIFVFVIAADLAVLGQNLLNTASSYPQFLVVGVALLVLNTFVLGFANLTKGLESNKWVLFGLNIVLVFIQGWTAQSAIDYLTRDSYPQTSFLYISIAAVAYVVQVLIGGFSNQLRLAIPTLIVYVLILGALFQKFFNADIRFLQLVCFLVVVLELVLLSWTLRWYLHGLTHKSEIQKS